MRWLAWAGLVVVVVAAALGGVGASSRMLVVNQGFEDVVVGISPQLDERRANTYIAALKKALNETSHALFKATGNRLFIRKVKVLVPISWKNVRVDQEASSESYENSDLRVAPKNGVYGDQVYTDHIMGCGEPGQYIHVTPAYLTHPDADRVWGPRGKVLAQAWATLRWGVFDERGYPDDETYPLFYESIERERLQPNHCSNKKVRGRNRDPNTRRGCNPTRNSKCRFVPGPEQTATTSLMSFTDVDSIEKFCGLDENGRHNAEAPNKHNKKCDGRSVGAVMADHQDFLGTTPLPVDHPVDPEVVVVQEVVAKFALVLDYSGSMSGQKIENLVETARRWLLHQVADGSFVAIVKFESGIRAVRGLTEVSSSTRQVLANEITPDASGGTCIGCGLQKALELLRGHNNKVIVLISDGAENESPMMADVMDDVVRSGARVTTIAYGKAAEQKMEELAQNTGGKVNFVPDNDAGKSMADAFQSSETYQPGQSIANSNIQIHEEDVTLSGTVASGTFTVDSSVGRNLRFELNTNSAGSSSTPYLTSPTGVQYTHAEFTSTLNLWIIKVDLAETGTWTWTLPASPSSTVATIKVTAQARDPNILPIYTEAWMSTGASYVNAATQQVIVFARVTQGGSPVVGARVRAFITGPDGSEEQLDLKDGGKFADAAKGDGVYSRYFMNFKGVGRYSVKAQVWDDGNSYVNNGFISSGRSKRSLATPGAPDQLDVREPCCGSVVPFDQKTATPTGSFTRTTSGGSFHVTHAPPAGSDSFPPARVLDLSANIKDSTTVTLSWTATGDDQDAGSVSGYVVWMSDDPAALASNLDDKSTVILLDFETSSHMPEVLKEAGKEITLEVTLQEPLKHDTVYAVALQAVDDVGNRSKLSTLGKFVSPAKPPPKGQFVAFLVAGCVASMGLITGARYLGY